MADGKAADAGADAATTLAEAEIAAHKRFTQRAGEWADGVSEEAAYTPPPTTAYPPPRYGYPVLEPQA